MDLSIIIVNYNTALLIKDCIESVKKSLEGVKYEIIIVDNFSTDRDFAELNRLAKKDIKIFRNRENQGFGWANNIGLSMSRGDFILFLNSDTLANDIKFIDILHWMKKKSSIGAMTCQLLNKDMTIQGTGGFFPTLSRVFIWMFFLDDIPYFDKFLKSFHPLHPGTGRPNNDFYTKPHEIDWITGAFFFARREALGNGFDEDYFMYGEDVDLSKRIREKGYKIYYNPKWSMIHLGGQSSTSAFPIVSEFESIKIYYKKHMPTYNYHLLRILLRSGIILRFIIYTLAGKANLVKAYEQAYRKI